METEGCENMQKLNCWEYKKCGREHGGLKADELGICAASDSGNGNGTNGGKCRGRICWAVSGTLCKGKPQGTFAGGKGYDCTECDFFHLVCNEEGENGIGFKHLLEDKKVRTAEK